MPNNGRFEGFKSSGKVGDIENMALQNDIMDFFYQENISNLLNSTHSFAARKTKFIDFLTENMKQETDSTTNLSSLLASDQAHNICANLLFTDEIIQRYDQSIAKSKKIIEEINQTYKE